MDSIRMIASNADEICKKLGLKPNILVEPINLRKRQYRIAGTSDMIEFTSDWQGAALHKLYFT